MTSSKFCGLLAAVFCSMILSDSLQAFTIPKRNNQDDALRDVLDGLGTLSGDIVTAAAARITRTATTPTRSTITRTSLTTPTGSMTIPPPSTTTTTTTTTTPTNEPSNAPLNPPPPRLVFAHHMVGNTYNYGRNEWYNDIAQAASKGIDAFALNVGVDSWEPGQIANAYAAAAQYASQSSTRFKLFFSFDMSSFPCSDYGHAAVLQNYLRTYSGHAQQQTYNGRALVSTFAGQDCRFGQGNLNDAWRAAVKFNGGPSVWFVPSFFVDPGTFNGLSVIDGAFQWNSAWPAGNYDINFDPDRSYINNLNNGRTYMAGVSPWFFTHYGPNTYNKNWIYRADDWMFAQRWELLVQNRNAVPLAQVISWNDYGESHYVGPIEGVQPNSQAWVNGFDHQGWLDLMQYYIYAYKNGAYPTITRDRIFLWSRLYPANANSPDSVARPNNYQWTQDYLWAVVLLTQPAQITLECGPARTTISAGAGLAKAKLQFPNANCAVKASIVRGSSVVVDFLPSGFNYRLQPPSYNFNAYVAASP